MKKDIHPKYYEKAKVSCACGNAFEIGSTENEIRTEICSACHPFYTGKQKLVDTARRVEKFKEKQVRTTAIKKAKGESLGKRKKRVLKATKKAIKKETKK